MIDGTSQTMTLIETTRDHGAWTAGGQSSVRAADPATQPYIESFQGPAMRLPGVRFSIRRMMLIVALAALMFSYVGSYYRLSRGGMREAALSNMPGFLYVPYLEAPERADVSRHYALMIWYAPLNWLDRTLLGTPGPTICLMRLSG